MKIEVMGKPKVVITDHGPGAAEEGKRIIGEAGFELVIGNYKEPADIINQAADADALLVGGVPITAEVVAALKNCKVIVRYGVGVDDIDIDAATAKGIKVCNVPDATTDEVADHTVALALALLRQLPWIDRRMRRGEWDITKDTTMPAFRDLTFATIGFGRIAKAVMDRLKPFKFRLAATDPHADYTEFERNGVDYLACDELFAQADIICINAPLTETTQHMIDATALAKMKQGVILVNTGRGGIIDTPALIDALRGGQVAYAGLDVFEDEPPPPDYPLYNIDNVLLTPHIAAYSTRSGPRTAAMAAEEVVRALRGESLHSQVNR
jgi:D-3-phosphoglycerate dehydrogenase